MSPGARGSGCAILLCALGVDYVPRAQWRLYVCYFVVCTGCRLHSTSSVAVVCVLFCCVHWVWITFHELSGGRMCAILLCALGVDYVPRAQWRSYEQDAGLITSPDRW